MIGLQYARRVKFEEVFKPSMSKRRAFGVGAMLFCLVGCAVVSLYVWSAADWIGLVLSVAIASAGVALLERRQRGGGKIS
jgi:hypothetical protein